MDNGFEGDPADDNQVNQDKHLGEFSQRNGSRMAKGDMHSEPYVGMEFDSQWAARSFYNEYAKCMGFATRISYSHRSKRDRKMIGQQYVCVKEGFPVHKEGPSKLPRLSARVGCKASMTVKRTNAGKWVVKSFIKEHNHELATPDEVEFLRSHPGLSNAAVNLINNIPGLAAHLNNIISRGKSDQNNETLQGQVEKNLNEQNGLPRIVSQATLDFFNFMQNENPSFVYALQLDEEGCAVNVFWADTRSKLAYECFCDVVMLDTTPLSRKYQIPLVSFVGINHHGQPVLFGCGLLSNQAMSSFVWLIRSWLAAMSGRHPVSVIIDYNKVIKDAFSEVCPHANLQFSMWHIRKEMLHNLGSTIRQHDQLEGELLKSACQTEEDEFESCWESFIDAFDLEENQWFRALYEDRWHWAPLFMKPTFFAEMPLSLKKDPIESFFGRHVMAETSLEDFLKDYNFILDSCYEREAQADMETPIPKTTSLLENKAASVYTREAFETFQTELFNCLGYLPNRVVEEGSISVYMVTKFGDKAYTVTFDFNDMKGSCRCRMFEFSGIICRHILSVLNSENVPVLPSHYILKRWTRDARIKAVWDGLNMPVLSNSRQDTIARYNDLCHHFIRVAEVGARSTEWGTAALHVLDTIVGEAISLARGVGEPVQPGGAVSEKPHLGEISSGCTMSNLNYSYQLKGEEQTSSNSKTRSDKDIRKMNTCNTCMKPGHNSQTCMTISNLEQDIVEDLQMGQIDWGMTIPSVPH